jgi:hypothetical protein
MFQIEPELTMDTNLLDLSQTVWKKVLDHVEDSVVFIDSLAGECLHWSLGTETLLQRGAAAIQEFNAYKASLYQDLSLRSELLLNFYIATNGCPSSFFIFFCSIFKEEHLQTYKRLFLSQALPCHPSKLIFVIFSVRALSWLYSL